MVTIGHDCASDVLMHESHPPIDPILVLTGMSNNCNVSMVTDPILRKSCPVRLAWWLRLAKLLAVTSLLHDQCLLTLQLVAQKSQ